MLTRRFTVIHPAEVWRADTAEFATGEGKLYLAAVIDLYARRIVVWSVSSSMRCRLASDALTQALHARGDVSGVLHHSDEGRHYTSADYRALMDRHRARASYSGRVQCLWGNAVAESFFGTLEDELVHRSRFATPCRGPSDAGSV